MAIATQNWDGVTPPAIPGGWNVSGTFTTVAPGSITPVSSPNVLEFSPSTNSSYFATYGTADGNSGNVIVSAYVAIVPGAGNQCRMGVTARCSASTMNLTSTSAYLAWLDWGAQTIGIGKVVSGTFTSIGSLSVASPPTSAWVWLALTLNATALQLQVQRYSDGYYLNPSGTWVSSQATCITQTDSSITGSGYSGLYVTQGSSGFSAFSDNWELDGVSPPVPMPRTLVVYYPFQYLPSYAE
jgi:hypothetical protein